MQYHLFFGGGNFASRANNKKKEAFLPHEGFPHNNLTIPPCLVFWWVSIPWARSIQGTAHGTGVIISRSVMKLFRQKDELWGNFTTWIFIDWSRPFLLWWCMVHTGARIELNAVNLVHKRYIMRHNYQQHNPSMNFWNKQFVSHLRWPARCRCPTLGLSAGRSPRSNTTQNPVVLPQRSPGRRFDFSSECSAWMSFGWAAFPTSFWTTEPHTWGIQLWNDRTGLLFHPASHWVRVGTV